MNPNLQKLGRQGDHAPNTGTTVLERFDYPLVFEPGSSWTYGSGIDWTGLLIERVTGMCNE